MISILGDYSYDFPCKIKLKYRLEDFLEKEVDEKFYLDEKDIERISHWKSQQKPLENVIDTQNDPGKVSPTITARGAGEDHSGMILVKVEKVPLKRGYSVDVKEDNPNSIDEIDYVGNYSKSSYSQTPIVGKNGVAPTFTENHGQVIAISEEILIKNNTEKGYANAKSGDGIDISGRMQYHRGTVQKDISQTLTRRGGDDVGVVVDDER